LEPDLAKGLQTMQTIFVQVKCELGKAYAVAEDAIERVESISEVYSTSGHYDLFLKCYLDDGADIGHYVTEKIQTLPGVKETFTTIAFKAFT
jgi:DNA-binding Lrp family transcriptional regulator